LCPSAFSTSARSGRPKLYRKARVCYFTEGGKVLPSAFSTALRERDMDYGMLIFVVAGAAAWTGDDWCPTPPRPPWPWPWLLRKLIAVIGGIGLVALLPGKASNLADMLTVGLVGMVGGVTLASLVGGLAGGLGARNVNVDRTGP
jgi:hypothetical protein